MSAELCVVDRPFLSEKTYSSTFASKNRIIPLHIKKPIKYNVSKPLYKTPKAILLEELKEVYFECNFENWNDEGSLKIEELSYEYIKDFIEQIPEGYCLPEVAPEPNGSIGLEWDINGYHLALSINKEKIMVYVVITSKGRHSGTLIYENIIPDEIMPYFKKMNNIV